MRLRSLWRLGMVLAVVASLFAIASASALARGPRARVGNVYTLTNAPGGNEVLIFDRWSDGSLRADGSAPTGGLGTGAGLGSQGALILDGRWLLAVNAGSDDISVLNTRASLQVRDVEPSGGDMPISVTIHGHLVYILNAGSGGNISGFRIDKQGDLTPIPGSTRPLSSANSGPAQIEFSPRGDWLIVTEKDTNLILAYPVEGGLAGDPVVTASAGATPFGFAFGKRQRLVVSEAFGGAPNGSALSSYALENDGLLATISASVGTQQTAACWVVISKNGKFAYTTNTGSNSVSAYAIGHDGSLTLIGNGVAGMTGAGPIDMGLSHNGRFLYTANTGDGSISAFAVSNSDGSLTPVHGVFGLGAGIVGLAAR